jgi:hypothetical protein
MTPELETKVKGWDVIGSPAGFESLVKMHNPSLFGGFNIAPVNFREVSEQMFAQDHYHTDYPELAMSYRQMFKDNNGVDLPRAVKGTLHINAHGYGWLIEKMYNEGKAKFYFFELCHHEYETLERSRCWWKGKCKKCGSIDSVDSSD